MNPEDKLALVTRRAQLITELGAPLAADRRIELQGQLSVVNAQIKALNTTEAARLKAEADRRRAAGMVEAQQNAARARANAAITDDDPGPVIDQWIMAMLKRSGIKTRRLSDGSLGLLDVPQKWAAIIDAFSAGLHAAARGEELPEITPKVVRK